MVVGSPPLSYVSSQNVQDVIQVTSESRFGGFCLYIQTQNRSNVVPHGAQR
jgi:hypothetical protein